MTVQPPPQPSWRKPAGTFLILALIAGWAVLAVTAAERIGPMPWPVEVLYYVVAGLVWIAPLKPVLRWMETGRWRVNTPSPTLGGEGRGEGDIEANPRLPLS